jgi:TetR/AcrR family transcriptional regulator
MHRVDPCHSVEGDPAIHPYEKAGNDETTRTTALFLDARSDASMSATDEPQPRPPGRPPATGESISAERILDVALRAFATHGYEGVSVRTLNKELGVSHSAIYQRFGSKDGLWHAAVDHGFGRITRHMADVFDPTLTDPLEQLRLWIHRLMRFSAGHPEILGLMNIEGRQDTARLAYIFDTYIEPAMGRVKALLDHLADTGRIRRVPLRTFHFLVSHGGAAPYTLPALAEHFDPSSPLEPEEIEAHAALVADLIVAALCLDNPSST